MNIDDNTKALVEAINGVRSTLAWACFWLFLIWLSMPKSWQIIDAIAEKAK